MNIIDKFKNLFKPTKPEMIIEIPFSIFEKPQIVEFIKKIEKKHSENYNLKFRIIHKM